LLTSSTPDPDPQQPGQPTGVDLLGDDPFDDPGDGLP
jgi:hypothetical protein